MALAAKRAHKSKSLPKGSPAAAMAKSMTAKQLRHVALKPKRKG
jgi:hypothetical protein